MTTMNNYAIVDASNLVVNVIVWDGIAPWAPPVNCVPFIIPTESPAAIGWTYLAGEFHAPDIDASEATPAAPPARPRTPAEKLAVAGLTVDDLKALLGLD